MRKTKDEAEKTHRLILSSALDLFINEGVERTTIGMIAEQSMISRGAVYWHFRNKERILKSVMSLAPSPMLYLFEQLEKREKNHTDNTVEEILRNVFEKYSKEGSDENGVARILYFNNDLFVSYRKMISEELKLSEKCINMIEIFFMEHQQEDKSLRAKCICSLLLWKGALLENLASCNNKKIDKSTLKFGLDCILKNSDLFV